jgi:hypothetical protein
MPPGPGIIITGVCCLVYGFILDKKEGNRLEKPFYADSAIMVPVNLFAVKTGGTGT